MISEHIMQAHGGTVSHHSHQHYGGEPLSKRPRASYEYSAASGGAYFPAAPPVAASEGDGAELTLAQRLRRNIQAAIHRTEGLDFGSSSGGQHGGLLSVELMRRYIEYAKQYVHPVLSTAAAKVLQRLYLNMRVLASAGQSIPVTTRHLESLIRLAQARARIDLREEVT